MLTKFRYFVFTSFLVASIIYSQTNVQGTINSNTTWLKSGSPYTVTGSITVRDGATLTIESGAEVKFSTSSYITIGLSSTSKGNLIAGGVKFTGMLSSDARIYFKNNSSAGTINNCSFDNTYLWIENSEITVNNSSFDNCVFPIVLEDGGKIIQANLSFGSNNQNFGIQFKGTIAADYTLKNYNLPFFVENLVVNGGAKLMIETGVEIYFPTTTPITVGSSSTSKGTVNASGVLFKGTASGDAKINFKSAAGLGTLDNCTFDNSYLLIENTQVTIRDSKFMNCTNPVIYEDGAIMDVVGLQYLSNVTYTGIALQGTIGTNLVLAKTLSPYYVKDLSVRDNAQLTIESGTDIFFTGSIGMTLGFSTTSKGTIIANGVHFKGLTTSDASVNIKYNSTSQITNCTFNNAYLNIDNSSPQIKNSTFTKCSYAIQTRNGAVPAIINNDFFNNIFALKNYGTNTITAENNFWGDPSGPTHTDNPNAKGGKAEGLIDFQPFAAIPYNGNIVIKILQPNFDFGKVVTGISKELTYKLVTSTGSINLFISKIETDNSSFTITSTSSYWLSSTDTLSLKVIFTPQAQQNYSGNLKLNINKQGSSPTLIPLLGTGVSPLAATPAQLSFGLVDLKNYKTIKLTLKNISTKSSVRIDSIRSTNSRFTFTIASQSTHALQYDESIYNIKEKVLQSELLVEYFTLSPGYSREIEVTFKPNVRVTENGNLEIYYTGNKKDVIPIQGEGFSSPLAINITSLNLQSFPYLFLNATVDTFNVSIDNLSASNFEVYENGVKQTDNLTIVPPGQSGNIRLTDIIFLMDNSGSMGDEHTAVSNNVINFVNQLASTGVDYQLGLCRYGNAFSNGNPIIEDNGILTADPNYFKNILWTKNVANGSKEPGYYAIKQSAALFNFRPGSQKIFIIITDEPPDQGGASIDEALTVCMENKITLFVLTNSSLYSSFRPITSVTNGEIYDIHSDFGSIFNFISNIISKAYVIQYKSSEPTPNNYNRQVVVKVNYKTNVSTDTVYYNPGSIPKIQRTASTLEYHTKSWVEGTVFKISASITDDIEPFVQLVTLYYKTTGQNYFGSIQMLLESGTIYTATIPVSVVNPPGVDYYITASDGNVSVSDPKLGPSQTPYQIAILPNVAPSIQHNIVESASRNTNVNINAEITDNTNSVAEAKLFYRTIGQLSYKSILMTKTTGFTYQGLIPSTFMIGDGVEYYIRAADDFGLGSYHGKSDAPHVITAVATSVTAILDTLTSAPSIKAVQVPSNGTGYCYFTLKVNQNPVKSQEEVKAILISNNSTCNVTGKFVQNGVFRLNFPNSLMISNEMSFKLGSGITVSDTFYSFNSSPFTIMAKKIPSPYQRTWTIFASGSAGVSGTAGSIGLGVSAAAAKLSVKGSAGAGLDFKLDQDNNRFITRRLEASLSAEVEAPKVNLAVASATVATVSATVKTFFGEQYSFTGLGFSSDSVKMAEAGFLLETMSYAGLELSPGTGVVLAALIGALNATSGVYSMYDDGYVNRYAGIGFEGSASIGFKTKFGPFELTALSPSASIALNLTSNGFNPNHPSNSDNTLASVKLSEAFNFNFSTLDFGLPYKDDVSLSGGNFSLFDAGFGSEISVEAKMNPSFAFNGLSVNLKGGGGINLFGANGNKSYSTTFNFSKEYLTPITDAGTSLIGLFTKTSSLPMGQDLLSQSVQTIKSTFTKVVNNPIEVTTEEINSNGFDFNLGVELDAALGVGLGISFGIGGKYLDEVSYTRKFSNIYLNGNNYLIYSSNYSDQMKSASFLTTLKDMFSGVIPLVKNSILNIVETVEQLIVAGKNFVLKVVNSTGDAVGTVVGVIGSGGKLIITKISSKLPHFFTAEPFADPKAKKMNYSKNVLHGNSVSGFTEYESNLIVFSQIMNVAFQKSGEITFQDTLSTPVTVKMIIYPDELIKAGFSTSDSSKVGMYVYDNALLSWVYLGGELNGDTLAVETNRLGAFGLGIELNQIADKQSPIIESYGPAQGSVWSSYPEVFVIVHDNKYGSGLDLVNSKLLINGKQVDLSYDPTTSKLFCITNNNIIEKSATNKVEFTIKDFAGNATKLNFEFRANITGIKDEPGNKYEYSLEQNYPNPFNPLTKINFTIPERADVEISIYDLRGRFVKSVFSGELEAGAHSVKWDGTNNLGFKVSSSVYFYKMKAKEYVVVKKMILVK